MSTITIAAHAVDLTVHVKIDPPHPVTTDDHPGADEGFIADVALWGWGGGSSVSLHDNTRPGHCLAYYDDDVIPDWLPRPPAEWDAAAQAFIATVKGEPLPELPVVDLVAALRASVEAAKARRAEAGRA